MQPWWWLDLRGRLSAGRWHCANSKGSGRWHGDRGRTNQRRMPFLWCGPERRRQLAGGRSSIGAFDNQARKLAFTGFWSCVYSITKTW